MKWECLAVTLPEIREFLSTIEKSKDANEKILRNQIQEHLVPILEKQEESRKRKQLQRERELLNLEKMAHAKRSSRIASKIEHQKFEERAREEEKKRREEEEARRKEELERLKKERERDRRLMSREQRLREREIRRLRHEEELAQLSEDSRAASTGSARMSERRRQAEIERNKKALQELEEEEEDWIFDCVCGVYGQVDDGTHSVACERCNTWQHSKCLGIKEEEADQDDFHFICSSCRRREQEESEARPRIIKIKVNRREETTAPQQPGAEKDTVAQPRSRTQLTVELESKPRSAFLDHASDQLRVRPNDGSMADALTSATQQGTTSDSKGEEKESGAAGFPPGSSPTRPLSAGQGTNPFSSPHPSLLPPTQPPVNLGPHGPNPEYSKPIPAHDDDDKQAAALADTTATRNGVLSTLAASGSGSSPTKQHQRPRSPPTKTDLSLATPSDELVGSVSAGNINSMTPPAIISPRFTPTQQSREDRSGNNGSPPLPPSSGGLSPTKQSPPVPHHHQPTGGSTTLPGTHHPPPVFPPVTALSPSPRQQILTPPVKPTEPVRVPPPQQQQ
jgi:hypothetical protein